MKPLVEKLINGFQWLSEQANSISKIEEGITNQGDQIIEHLIKILKFDDIQNNSKHCRDIDQKWLKKVEYFLDRSNKKPKKGKVSEWLYYEIKNKGKLQKRIDNVSREYGSLKPYRTDSEIISCLDKIFDEIDNQAFYDESIQPILSICKKLSIEVKGLKD